MPDLHRLAIAQFLAGEVERDPVRHLSQLGSGLSYLYLLPPTSRRRGDTTANKKRKAQELLGEHDQRLVEIETSFLMPAGINGHGGVLTLLANTMSFISAFAETEAATLAS